MSLAGDSVNQGERRTALVTGANRGIGYEACRQLGRRGMRVVLTSRDEAEGRRAAEHLRNQGLDVLYQILDVSSSASVEACARQLQQQDVAIDVLVNNAGVYVAEPILDATESAFLETLQVNLLGAWRMCRIFVPDMVARGYGRVVNVSSGMGQMTVRGEPSGGAYGISKASLNALTRELANLVQGDIKINSMCPGWVATRMGGSGAPRTPEQAVGTLVWLSSLPMDGPQGGFFRDRKSIPW